jgi:hypothetical protein
MAEYVEGYIGIVHGNICAKQGQRRSVHLENFNLLHSSLAAMGKSLNLITSEIARIYTYSVH